MWSDSEIIEKDTLSDGGLNIIETFPTIQARFVDVDALWVSHNGWRAGQRQSYPAIDAAVIWVVQKGQVEASIGERIVLVGAGEVCWQPPQQARHLRALEAAEWRSIALRARWFSRTSVWPESGATKLTVRPKEREQLEACLEQLVLIRRNASFGAALQKAGCTQWILGFCLEKLGGMGDGSRIWPEWLAKALRELEADPQLEIDALAARVGYSPTQFRVRFRQSVGQSPGEFAAGCLRERARQMLAGTDWTVNRIAKDLGFGEATHFTRFFKRQYGMTPREYRASLEERG